MRSTSLIAGSLGLTLVAGGLLVLTAVGAAALVLLAPTRDDEAVREALVDARDELAWCAAGTAGGRMTITLVLHRGEARHVGVTEASVSTATAECVAEALVTRPWPRVSAAAVVPVVLER